MEYILYFTPRHPKPLPGGETIVKLKKMGIWEPLVNAYMTGDLERITDAFSECGHLLLEKKDPLAYAKKLEKLMTAGK